MVATGRIEKKGNGEQIESVLDVATLVPVFSRR